MTKTDSFQIDSNSHAVIVYFFNYLDDELDKLHALDLRLEKAIREAGVGVYDWHEINMDGPDGYPYTCMVKMPKIYSKL